MRLVGSEVSALREAFCGTARQLDTVRDSVAVLRKDALREVDTMRVDVLEHIHLLRSELEALAPLNEAERELRHLDPAAVLERHLSRLLPGTRLWLVPTLLEWVAGVTRVFWLYGDAGVGKSGVAAMAARELRASAVHFVAHNNILTRTPSCIVGSLAAQLVRAIPSFKVPADVRLLIQDETPDGLFSRVIGTALQGVRMEDLPGGRLLIVIDGLHEAVSYHEGALENKVLDMLLEVERLPAWVRVLITSRDEERIRRALNKYAYGLRSCCCENIEDLRLVLRDLISPMVPVDGTGMTEERAVQAVLEKANGSFLYVRRLLSRLSETRVGGEFATLTPEFIDELPDTMFDMLSDDMRRVTSTVPKTDLAPLLEVLVAAVEPLTLDMLEAVTGLSSTVAARCFHALTTAAVFKRSCKRLIPFHKLVVDWLLHPMHGAVSATRGHARLAMWARRHLFGNVSAAGEITARVVCRIHSGSIVDKYAFAYYLVHLQVVLDDCVVCGSDITCEPSTGAIVETVRAAAVVWFTDAFSSMAFFDGVVRRARALSRVPASLTQLCELISNRQVPQSALQFARYFLSTGAWLWLLDPVTALLPACSGKYGPHVALSAREWYDALGPPDFPSQFACLPALTWSVERSVACVLRGHYASVRGIAISPDGSTIVSSGDDSVLHVWDSRSCNVIRAILNAHNGSALAVAFSDDGLMIASCDGDSGEAHAVKLWSTSSWECMKTLLGHTDGITCVCVAPGSSIIASGSLDCSVRLWQVENGSNTHILLGHTDSVCSVRFTPDGTRVVSCSRDTSLRLWDAATGGSIHVLIGHTTVVNSVAIEARGGCIASGSDDCTVRLWDPDSGAQLRALCVPTDAIGVSAVCFSQDGRRVASGTVNASIFLWSTESGDCVRVLSGHCARITSLDFFPGDRRLASCSVDKTVMLWATPPEADRAIPPSDALYLLMACTSIDGATSLSAWEDGAVCVHDTQTGALRTELRGHRGAVNVVAMDSARDMVASGGTDCAVRLWRCRTGVLLRTLCVHVGSVRTLCWTSDGHRLASGADDKAVIVWDAASGHILHVFGGNSDVIVAIAFSMDGRSLASVVRTHALCNVWNMETGAPVGSFVGSLDPGSAMCFSTDGRAVAIGNDVGLVYFRDVAPGGREQRMVRGHSSEVLCVAFSQDEDCLVSGAADGSIFVSRIDSGVCTAAIYLPHSISSVSWLRSITAVDVVGVGFRGCTPRTGTCLIISRGNGAPQVRRIARASWTPDDAVRACQLCEARFRAWTRRHHCRLCGGAFCDNCSSRVVGFCECEFCGESAAAPANSRLCGPCVIVHDAASACASGEIIFVPSDASRRHVSLHLL